uniref:WAT1-related protein At3g28050-like n=1 Tax=Rhizophora mucronata TaxID=61149 RepID=A0A2P2IJY7_RHIMU
MGGRYCYRDVLPFIVLVAMECINVGLNTLFKAATVKGMSYHVFIVYAYAIAALFLLPAPFVSRRSVSLFYIKITKRVYVEIKTASVKFLVLCLHADRGFFLR